MICLIYLLLANFLLAFPSESSHEASLTQEWNTLRNSPKIYSLMNLYKKFSNEVINNPNESRETRGRALKIRDNEIRPAIIDTGADLLKKDLLEGNYGRFQNNIRLATNIHEFNEEISDEIIRKIIDYVFDKRISIHKNIVHDIYSNEKIPQIVEGLTHIFWKLKQRQNMNNPAILIIADYLKRIQNMKNYKNLSDKKKANIENVKQLLPHSVRNLYFAKKVCFRSKWNDEYMYAPGNQYTWTPDRRYIFTWGPGDIVREASWYAKSYDDGIFEFVNEDKSNEYLYIPEIERYNTEYYYLFTWIPGGSLGKKSSWNISIRGDEIALSNLNYREVNACLTPLKEDSDRLRVLGTNISRLKRHDRCYWIVESC